MFFFFFKQKTAFEMRMCYWSSDVCSSDLAALKAQAAASSAASRIHFVGRVPHGEVELYYSLIDILAYPRKKMRLTDLVTPLKPLEAMAQGKLVAASDVGGHRELIEDGATGRSEEHTSELQSLMRISYAVFCLKKKNTTTNAKR